MKSSAPPSYWILFGALFTFVSDRYQLSLLATIGLACCVGFGLAVIDSFYETWISSRKARRA